MKGRELYPPGLAARFVGAKQAYRPSNGTEGELFQGMWCHDCKNFNPASNAYCPILIASWLYMPGEPEYPAEWMFDEDGQPVCTAFDDKQASV